MHCQLARLALAILLAAIFNGHTYADIVNWVDFSTYPTGQTSVNGLTSADGLQMDAAFTNTTNMNSTAPQYMSATINDVNWPFDNSSVPLLWIMSNSANNTLSTTMRFSFTNPGGLPSGGSIGIFDLEDIGSSTTLTGYQNGSIVPVTWAPSFYELQGANVAPPVWNPLTNTLSGILTPGMGHPTINSFVFLTSDVQLDAIEFQVTGSPFDGILFAATRSNVAIPEPSSWLLGVLAFSNCIVRHARHRNASKTPMHFKQA